MKTLKQWMLDLKAKSDIKAEKKRMKEEEKEELDFRYKRYREIEYLKDYERKFKRQPPGLELGLVFNYSDTIGCEVLKKYNKFIKKQ